MGRRFLGGSGEPLTVWISIAASTVLIFYGYDQGVFGNVLINEDFLRTVGNPSVTAQGTMTSVYNLGCFGGALSTLYTGDKLGRPRTLMLGSITIAIGAVVQAACMNAGMQYAGRVIAGLGTGMNTATAGVWQSETSKMRSRGKLIIIQMANCITGFALSNWLTLGFSFVKNSSSWRFPLAFQMFFSLLICLMCPFLPDSPRLLIRKGRYDEAYEVLAALEGNGATVNSPSVRTQFAIIKEVLDKEYAVSYSWLQIITGKGPAGVLRRMILGAWMQASNQISGINVTSYYMTYVFINAIGFNELTARILAAAGSMDYLFFSFMAYFVIERFGRRKVMMTSATACSICWTVIAITMGLSETGRADSYRMGAVAVSFFFLFFASFAMGVLGVSRPDVNLFHIPVSLGSGAMNPGQRAVVRSCHFFIPYPSLLYKLTPISRPWLYPTEVNALAFRAKGAALAMSTNWIMNYMVAQITPPGIENLGYKFWIIWAVICAAFVPITFVFYPETANRSLEDIDRFFADNHGVFVFNNKLATQLRRPSIYEEADRQIAVQNEKLGESEMKTNDATYIEEGTKQVS